MEFNPSISSNSVSILLLFAACTHVPVMMPEAEQAIFLWVEIRLSYKKAASPFKKDNLNTPMLRKN